MKTTLKSSIFAASAVAVYAIATGMIQPAGANNSERRVMATHGAVFDIGSKHAVSYYTADSGACNVTVMIGDKADDAGQGASVGTRMSFTVDAKRTARADTADGQSLEFSCAKDAATLDVRPVERLAYVAAAK
jgi:hypothetical protein